METLEKSRMCRLCGKNSGISIDIFDKKESHVRKINAILPILVHELDLLPKQMCHRCSYKLEEFYNFYVDCAKTDSELKSQLSWMRKEDFEEEIKTPMVKINPFKIKAEPKDEDGSIGSDVFGHISESSLFFPASILQSTFDPNASPMLTCSKCRCLCSEGMKENKSLVKKKDSPEKESNVRAHSSTVTSNTTNKLAGSIGSVRSVDNESDASKNLLIDLNDPKAKEIPVVNLENVGHTKLERSDDKSSHIDHLDRALRPRKGSIDYKCQKKKGLASNLKTKLKSTLDMLNPELVNPVESTVLTQRNASNNSPVIKLEKVDDTVKNLRTRKNLEQFNKSIKQFQRERKSLHKESNLRKRILRKSIHDSNHINLLQKDESHGKIPQQVQELSRKNNVTAVGSDQVVNLHLKEKNTDGKSVVQPSNDMSNHSRKTVDVRIKQESISKSTENAKSPSKTSETLKSTKEKNVALNDDKSDSSKIQEVSKLDGRSSTNAVVKEEKDYSCNVDYPRIKIKRHTATINASKSSISISGTTPSEEKNNATISSAKNASTDGGTVSPKNLRSKEKRPKVQNTDETKKKCRRLDVPNKQESPDKMKKSDSTSKQTNVDKSKKLDLPSKQVNPEKKKKLDLPSKLASPEKSKKSDLPSKPGCHEKIMTTPPLKYYCEECDICFRNKEVYKLHPCYQK